MPTTAAENSAWLRARFAGLVLDQDPADVLDVGCGGGAVLDLLAAGGVHARGVEFDAGQAEEARSAGFDVQAAAAEALPFEDRACDWVVMRHVPHHLADERLAFAEALRVARRGVVVAEPRFDPDLPSQCVAARADRWLKTLHERQGRIHRPDLPAARLVDGLRALEPDLQIAVHGWLRLRARPVADLDLDARAALEAVGAADDHESYAALRADAVRTGLTWNGSVAVVALRSAT